MYNIKNLVNSPYRIGDLLIPARGTLEGVDLTAAQLSLLKSVGYFKVEEVAEPVKRGRPAKVVETEASKED